MTIYLVIGGSHAGKTSFVLNSFGRDRPCVFRKDLVGLTEYSDCILFGDYTTDKRTKGTDTITRSWLDRLFPQIEKLLPLGKDIVLEGDKIISRPLFDKIAGLGVRVQLIWVKCSLETSLRRNREFHSTAKESTLKGAWKKAENIYKEYYSKFDGIIVYSDTIEDFSEFSLQYCAVHNLLTFGLSDARLF